MRWWLVRPPQPWRNALQPRGGPAAILHDLHGGGADAWWRTCQSVTTLYVAPWRQPTGAGPAAPAPPPHQAGQAHQQPPADVQSAENPAATSPGPSRLQAGCNQARRAQQPPAEKRGGAGGSCGPHVLGTPPHHATQKSAPGSGPDLARVNTGVEWGLGRDDVGSVPTLAEDVGGGAEAGERSSTAEQTVLRGEGDVWRRGGRATPDVSGDLFLPTSRDIQRNCETAQWWSGVLRGRVVSLYDLSA